jgi:hypothetical protein
VTTARPRYDHLLALTDGTGLFEHALITEPRPEHGYCVDDVARGLVVLCRAGYDSNEPDDDRPLARVAWGYLQFLRGALEPDGRVVNRRDVHGVRQGVPEVGDCWGRALWGLGTAASRAVDAELARSATTAFELGAHRRSPWPHAMAYAGLGASEVLRIDSGHAGARALLVDAAAMVGPSGPDQAWPWPWPRLSYGNAVFPDLLLAAGDALGDDALTRRGLHLLGWLLDVETMPGHFSVTPVAGWAPGEPRPGFDQQPIEVSALADACARAFELTGDGRWARAVDQAAAWFFGANDTGAVLADERTGGCRDGLEAHGRNENQGAESTLALLSTLQHAGRLNPALRS